MRLEVIARQENRLSQVLKDQLCVSAGLINRLKWEEKLLVNGVPVHTNFQVHPGDRVALLLEEPAPDYPAQPGQLDILLEDEHLLVVEKPAGMLIHPSRHRNEGTLANIVLWHCQQQSQVAAFHPVTRLDRDTYGLVLVAKHSHSHARLQELARAGQVQKTYHALVFGGPREDAGVVDAPIARRELPSLLRYVNSTGKPSRTEYRVLRRWSDRSLLELTPVTGRTHQLRVHCAYMGCPILGDPQYGTQSSLELSARLGLESQRLCAKQLRFVHPITGEEIFLQSRQEAEV